MPKYHIMLDEATAEALKAQGINSLSRGIELMYRARAAWEQGPTPSPQKAKRPHDPRNPTGDGRTQTRLDNEDAKAEKLAAIRLANHKATLISELHYCGDIKRLYRANYFDDKPEGYDVISDFLTPEEIAAARTEYVRRQALEAERHRIADINTAETKRLAAAGLPDLRGLVKPQTLSLTVTAQRRLGLFGTPEAMTDEQIAETNAAYGDDAPVEAEHGGIDE